MTALGTMFFPEMNEREPWVPEEHLRPGVAHHETDALFHIGFVTVNRAFDAGWFLRSKPTELKALQRVRSQFGATGTEGGPPMEFRATQTNHRFHGFHLC